MRGARVLATIRKVMRLAVVEPLRRLVPERHRLGFDLLVLRLTGRAENELLVLDRIVEGREVALDIGANRGYYSYTLARRFGRVVAFEPNPAEAADLCRHAPRNVTVHNVALSASEGTMELFVPVVNGVEYTGWASFNPENLPGASDFRVVEVPVRPLDGYAFDAVSFVKIDVEGHEREVLRGAEETLRRHRPVVLIEVKKENREPVFEAFRSLGYTPHRVHGRILFPLGEGSGAEEDGGENYVFKPVADAPRAR